MITFSPRVAGQMTLALFLLGIASFALSVIEPVFAPIAIVALAGGAAGAGLLWRRHMMMRRPTLSAPSREEEDDARPIQPR